MKSPKGLYQEMIQLITDSIGYCLYGDVPKLNTAMKDFGARLALMRARYDGTQNPQHTSNRLLIAMEDALKDLRADTVTTVQLGAFREATQLLAMEAFVSEDELETALQSLNDSGLAITPSFYLEPKRSLNEQGGLDATSEAE